MTLVRLDAYDAYYYFAVEIVKETIEKALSMAKEPVKKERGSRAPYCYGYEYKEEFGHLCKIGIVSEEHEKLWRNSPYWPNVPPPAVFYSQDHKSFQHQCQSVFDAYNGERRRKERIRRKEHKEAYDQYYNGVRKTRRHKRKRERVAAVKAYRLKRQEEVNKIFFGCK